MKKSKALLGSLDCLNPRNRHSLQYRLAKIGNSSCLQILKDRLMLRLRKNNFIKVVFDAEEKELTAHLSLVSDEHNFFDERVTPELSRHIIYHHTGYFGAELSDKVLKLCVLPQCPYEEHLKLHDSLFYRCEPEENAGNCHQYILSTTRQNKKRNYEDSPRDSYYLPSSSRPSSPRKRGCFLNVGFEGPPRYPMFTVLYSARDATNNEPDSDDDLYLIRTPPQFSPSLSVSEEEDDE